MGLKYVHVSARTVLFSDVHVFARVLMMCRGSNLFFVVGY